MKIIKFNEFVDNSDELNIKFIELSEKAESICGFFSNPDQKVDHPTYKDVLKLGKNIIPFLLEKMDTDFRHIWMPALNILTCVDPIPEEHRGQIDIIAEDWKKWGKENGY
jgi:hypothetical protein